MISLRPGMVIVTQGSRLSGISWGVRLFTGSWWTHAFLVLSDGQGIEAWVPKVRLINVKERLESLRKEGRDFVVLDYPGIDDVQRAGLENIARGHLGRLYDYAQIGVYMLTGKFIKDGPLRTVCSRFLENVYAANDLPLSGHKYLAPGELLKTRLVKVYSSNLLRFRI